MSASPSFWSVAQTHPQREHLARMLLMRKGFETYAPRVKIKNRICLLFPSYIFVRVVDRQWYPIRWTFGVRAMLMNGDEPAKLRDHDLKAIRNREVRGLVRLPPPRTPPRGQKLRIIRGPFRGHDALFDGMTGPDRQRVLLALLGQTVSVELMVRDATTHDLAS